MDELLTRLRKQLLDAQAENKYEVTISPGDLRLVVGVLELAAHFALSLPR